MSNSTISSLTQRYIFILIGLVLLLIISQNFYKRFDLTQDKRYTLSDITIEMLDTISSPLEVELLLNGKSTSEFRRLQQETIQILEELTSVNKNIRYRVVHPQELDVRTDLHEKIKNFQIRPAQIQIKQD